MKDIFCKIANQRSNNDWKIIGNGEMGDKAKQLMDKRVAIEKAGFVSNQRTVFAMDCFIESRIRDNIQLENDYNFPLAIRSSAFGDSRGTGIYESVFANQNPIEPKIIKVLESEFSQSAKEYRKTLSLKAGMAIIIEPVFGSWFYSNENFYGPIFSGIAHTCNHAGVATGLVNGGLPFFAVNGIGLPITEKSKTVEDSAKDLDLEFFNWLGIVPVIAYAKAGLFFNDYSNEPDVFSVPENFSRNLNLQWLFDKLKKLQDILKKPQYVEWALKEENGIQKSQYSK